jgi:hypothetical protein
MEPLKPLIHSRPNKSLDFPMGFNEPVEASEKAQQVPYTKGE